MNNIEIGSFQYIYWKYLYFQYIYIYLNSARWEGKNIWYMRIYDLIYQQHQNILTIKLQEQYIKTNS